MDICPCPGTLNAEYSLQVHASPYITTMGVKIDPKLLVKLESPKVQHTFIIFWKIETYPLSDF